MIEEIATVSKIKDFQVSVQSTQSSSCGKCAQQESCGTSLLDKYFVKRHILVDTDLDLSEGDQVLLGVDEAALLKGSLLIYIVPLLALFLGAFSGQLLASFIQMLSADISSACLAFLFFMLSLFSINRIQQSVLMQYFARPVVIRKL